MALFEKSYQAVKEFEAVSQAAKAAFLKAQKEIFETYSSAVADQKLAEARELLTKTEWEASQKALEIVQPEFAAVHEMIAETVTRGIPEAFAETLAAVKSKGERISEYEAAAFLKKYRTNYMGFSSILEVLHSYGKAGNIHIRTPEMLNNDVEVLEKRLVSWIRDRNGVGDSNYFARLIIHEKSPLVLLADRVQGFLDGDFILN